MNLTLTKRKLYWLGVGIISFYYLLNKFDFIFHASCTEGIAMGHTVISFTFKNKVYEFNTVSNVEYSVGEKVPVIFKKENPGNAYVFSFLGFWYSGLIFTLVPLALWSAFALAFFHEEDKIFLSFFKKSKPIQFSSNKKKLN